MLRLFPPDPGPTTGEWGDPRGIYDELTFPPSPGGRPYVLLNMVATVDGKATLQRGAHPRPIGSQVDRALMARLRVHADAVIRGAGTVRRAPYYPRVPAGAEPAREAAGRAAQPLACVISRSGRLPADSPFFRQAPRRPVVVAGPEADEEALAALGGVAEVVRAPAEGTMGADGSVNAGWVLEMLHRRYGVTRVLSEGGPTLNHGFFEAGVVDELFVTVAPFVAGNGGELTLVDGPGLLQPFPELDLISAFAHESELFLRYRVRRPATRPADPAGVQRRAGLQERIS